MRARGLERKLVAGVLTLFLVPTAAVAAILVLLYRRGVFEDGRALLLTLVVGLLAMMLYLGLVAHALGRSLLGTLHEIRHGAELMTTVHPEHRIAVRTGDELEALAGEVNRLADQLRDARLGLGTGVADSTGVLRAERTRLAAIVSQLSGGVMLVSLDGRIALANPSAQQVLSGGESLLGRNLFDLVEPGLLAGCIERLNGGSRPVERFTLVPLARPPIAAGMTAFRGEDGRPAGFLLALGEATSPAEALDAPLVVEAARRFAGAGFHSGVAADVPGPSRSELYDFSALAAVAAPVVASALESELARMSFVVFDVETTGLSPGAGDRVVSLAGVKVRSAAVRLGETFDALVQPERLIPPGSTLFHGITDAMVAGAPRIDAVLPAFLRFAEGSTLVGHEVSFDLTFLDRDAERLGLKRLASTHPVLDTRLLSRLVHGRATADHTLEAVAHRLGVAIRGRHSALGDALATAEVLVRLVMLLERRSIRTLGQVLDAIKVNRLGS
jgi:DNA polymerase-3 subunit epsilon